MTASQPAELADGTKQRRDAVIDGCQCRGSHSHSQTTGVASIRQYVSRLHELPSPDVPDGHAAPQRSHSATRLLPCPAYSDRGLQMLQDEWSGRSWGMG